MADPLGGDVFDVEGLAEIEIEKLLKQVSDWETFLLLDMWNLIEKFSNSISSWIFHLLFNMYIMFVLLFIFSIAKLKQNDWILLKWKKKRRESTINCSKYWRRRSSIYNFNLTANKKAYMLVVTQKYVKQQQWEMEHSPQNLLLRFFF